MVRNRILAALHPRPFQPPPLAPEVRRRIRRFRWRYRLWRIGAWTAAVLAVTAVAGYWTNAWGWWDPAPVYVVVVGSDGDPLELRPTLENSLAQLEGVQVLSSELVAGDSVEEIVTATGAEVITYEVDTSDTSYAVTIRRGERSASFAVPAAAIGARDLASEVAASHARSLFSWRRTAGKPLLDVSPEVWAEYLSLRQSEIEATQVSWERYLARLEKHIDTYPENLDARAKAGSIARYLYQRDHDPDYLERGRRVLDGAPNDRRITFAKADLAVAAGDLGFAEELLISLPAGYVGSTWLEAEIAAKKDNTAEQLRILRRAIDEQLPPLWWHLSVLGNAEIGAGLFADARAHFKRLLEISSGNIHGLSGLAAVELIIDPASSLGIIDELISISAQPQHFVDRATAEMLLGRYDDALISLSKAETLGYRHAHLYLDRADCYSLIDRSPANSLYQYVVSYTEGAQDFGNLVARAKALASLGHEAEALETVHGLTPMTPYQSMDLADVYVRVGAQTSADRHLAQARSAGFSQPWFTFVTVVAATDPLQNYRGQQ